MHHGGSCNPGETRVERLGHETVRPRREWIQRLKVMRGVLRRRSEVVCECTCLGMERSDL